MASPSSVARTRRPNVHADPDDAMSVRAAEWLDWAQKNARLIIGAGVVLALAAAGFFYYRWYKQDQASRAAAQYTQVSATAAQAGLQGVKPLEDFVRQYDGTNEADEARLALAGIYLDANQPQKALPYAQEVAGSGGPLSFQGRMIQGAVQARTNQRDAAIATFLGAAEDAELLYQRMEARDEAAQLREMAGDWKGAADVYRQMIEDTEEGSADRAFLQMRLAEAEMRARGGR